MKLLLCTQNPNKIKEIKQSLKNLPVTLISLLELNDITDVEETALTLKENALLKVKYFANKHQMIAIADDTGLEVKALNNRPGVFTSRYAKTDEQKILKLVNELKNHINKQANFVTVIALYNPFTNKVVYFNGVLNGEIIDMPRGNGGFGYDPIFFISSLNKTLAELTIAEKDKISHRGKALELLKEYIYENINNF